MTTINEFHTDFLQTILSIADSRGMMNGQAFFEMVCEDLLSNGELTNNYTEADIRNLNGRSPIEAYGYDYDSERKMMSVLTHQFFQNDEIETLTISIIEQKLKRLHNFVIKSCEGLYKSLEETSQAYSMSYRIYKNYKENKIDKFKFYLLSDGITSRNLKETPMFKVGCIDVEIRIIDMEYLFKNFTSKNINDSFTVEVEVPCLKIPSESITYQSFLTYFTGEQLANIYEKYGQRLLEQNVRTFLQFRGNVNKGIRNTISGAPDNFFAFNNGITATASKVEIEKGLITKIYDFQIVNGGQTTSSIYAARKNDKLDVSKVSVQVKLSVINDEANYSEFVSKIAEFANTQNKINKSDFFSNSPFHKEMKNYSNRIWVAPKDGGQRMTRWYYERVRGEYLNEQLYLTPAKKKQFQIENPKNQLIDKTFLSKSELAWLQKPFIVSRGAQYCFSDFAEYISNLLEKNSLAITERYFKEAISRIILFRGVEKIISNASWYSGGYRAQTVAYTISYLSKIVKDNKKFFNFDLIWELQTLPLELSKDLESIARSIYKILTNPPYGQANISQWAKKQECWNEIKKQDFKIEVKKEFFKESEHVLYEKKEDRSLKELDTGIEIQTFVIQLGKEKWSQIYTYCNINENRKGITSFGYTALNKISTNNAYLPTEAQSRELYKIYKKVIKEGFVIK